MNNDHELIDNHEDKDEDTYQSDNYNPIDELTLIDLTLKHLELTMNKYLDDVHQIWETEIVPFINSPECLVFRYLGERDFSKFLNFMLTQNTYKLIVLAKQRLGRRKMYIISTHLRPNSNKSSQRRPENRCK